MVEHLLLLSFSIHYKIENGQVPGRERKYARGHLCRLVPRRLRRDSSDMTEQLLERVDKEDGIVIDRGLCARMSPCDAH